MFNLRLRPLRMFLLDPRFGKCTREQTHFQCQDEALFFRHCPMKLDSLSFRARIGDGHEQNVNTERCLSASSDSPDDEKRFLPGRDRVWQQRIRGLMRQIFLASKEAQERTALQRDVIANRPAQHGIASLKRIEH